jgi:multidrug efflux pump subunit AcrA (membrane-fusion protein)
MATRSKTRQTELDFAKSTYERWHKAPIGVASVQGTLTKQDDFEIAAARLRTAMAEMNVVQGKVDGLRQRLNFKRITSPLDGVLIERNLKIGMPVNDGCGTVERPDRAPFRVIDKMPAINQRHFSMAD